MQVKSLRHMLQSAWEMCSLVLHGLAQHHAS